MTREAFLALVAEWEALPAVEWRAKVESMTTGQRMEADDALSAAAVHFARCAAYIGRRHSGGDHSAAVKRQNEVARRCRRALGFTYPDSLTF